MVIMKKKILIVVGTRPNFIKVTQFKKVVEKYPRLEIKIVHTSQHYSDEMSNLFFKELNLQPDYFLEVSPQLSTVSQMAKIMEELEKLIKNTYFPDLIMVVGDVNSTLAGSLVANKMNIPLAHLESGLRSFDNTMPEEHNRVLTDKLSNYFFVTEEDAIINLKKELVKEEKIFFVGNTMIDTLVAYQNQIEQSSILKDLNLTSKRYFLFTIHRPNNVDSKEGLEKIVELFTSLHQNFSDNNIQLVFPIHPRTKNNFIKFNLLEKLTSITSLIITSPQSYLNFQKLIKHALVVITDSGGVQEETTYLKIPCITLRPGTERPVTLWEGSNIILPFETKIVLEYLTHIMKTNNQSSKVPALWDGKATERVVEILNKIL